MEAHFPSDKMKTESDVLKRLPNRLLQTKVLRNGNDVQLTALAKALLLVVIALCHVTPIVTVGKDIPILDSYYDKLPDFGIVSRVAKLWDSVMFGYSPFTICFGVSVAVHITVYAAWSFPGFLFQFIPFMDRYKHQQQRVWTREMQFKCLKYVLFSQIAYQVPFSCMIYYFVKFMGFSYDFASIPKWYNLCIAIFGCSCIEDTWHYFVHRYMHEPWLYKRIHKMHHEFQNPFSLTAEYAHPLEQAGLGIGFALGLVIYGTHIAHVWLWMACRTLQACEAHSGYDVMLFINPWRVFPWYAADGHHDFHHENFVGNYGSFYTWWDDVFDTSVMYRRRRRAQQTLKTKLT